MLPVLSLSVFSFYDATEREHFLFAGGQLFSAFGDFLLSAGHEGFIPGAISFGIGNCLYIVS
jgi:uncharacterized membrane protein YhhN